MAKAKTARDLARTAELGPQAKKPAFDPVRVAESLGLVLLLAFGLLLAWQSWLASKHESDGEVLAAATTKVRDVVAAEAAAVTRRLEQVARDPAVVAAFAQGAAMDLAATRDRLRTQLGDPVDVELIIGGDVMDSVGTDIASFGYAKLDILRQAESLKGLPPVQMLREENESRSLAAVAPVLEQTRILGYILARFDASKIEAAIASWHGTGRIDLRQGGGEGITLFASGENLYLDRESPTLPVPRTSLRLVYGQTPSFALVTLGFGTGLLIALLCFGGAGALAWRRLQQQRLDQAPPLVQTSPVPAADTVTPDPASGAGGELPPPPPAGARSTPPPTLSSPPTAGPSTGRGRVPAMAVDRSIFRAYDIRGVIDKTLNPDIANLIGRAVGSEIRARNLKEVVVARDGRLSGPALIAGLIEGLRATGCDVIDIGMVPTPVLYFATYELRAHSGVMVTGSHNPPDYNGFKIVVGGETLSDQAIQNLYARIAESRFATGSGGIQAIDVLDAYVERISADIQLEIPLNVAVDCGNGVAGVIAEKLLASIGAEVMPLFTEVDGNFPNHHPDPSDPHNLQDLKLTTQKARADIGVAFDGDGDRLGVVTPAGKIVNPDRLLMLFAQDVLQRVPGASVIFDVKCTGHLASVIRAAGGIPIMWKTGHSLIKGKMKETAAELAGEMSGHFFFKERWFGFDDGLYAACRLLEIVAASGQSIDELCDALPDSVSTPELKVPMTEGEHYRFVEKFKEKSRFDGARISNLDGVRADWDDGWGLVRCSNTTPVLVLRFDADSEAALQRIQDVFRKQLLAVDKNLQLPF